MTVLISQSSPTLQLHPLKEGRAQRVPNRPFNDDGELYATGAGVGHGWTGLFIDRAGGMQVNVGNARYNEGQNFIRLWNHSKDRSVTIDLPVRAVWFSANGRSEMLVSVYLTPEHVSGMGFESGDTLALQSRTGQRATKPPAITLVPVFLQDQVLPHLKK